MAPTTKLHGRAFYESLGSPKYIVAPMVDQSEFAWRLLTRSFLPPDLRTSILAYSPMLHAKLFSTNPKYRDEHFKPLKPSQEDGKKEEQDGEETQREKHLDGNPDIDRPLFVQFCANDPDTLLEAAKHVQAHCDAVDLNLGCPQGIAKKGKYGAFLQEDQHLIYRMINTLHKGLDIPVTAKMRILDTKEKTLAYARMILSAGASCLTVHGRQRDQKGHWTGLADWKMIRYLRDNLPPETVLFANGNILQYGDLQRCLEATGADAIMSAEGNLYDPAIFAPPPPTGQEGREYWRGRDGKGGFRADAILRRYMDIIYTHVLQRPPPARAPLFLPSDSVPEPEPTAPTPAEADDQQPPAKKQKRDPQANKKSAKLARPADTNLGAMQAHLFHLLRALVAHNTHVRDRLARCKAGDMGAYEEVLSLTEKSVREGLLDYESDPGKYEMQAAEVEVDGEGDLEMEGLNSDAAVGRCKRPWWICQSFVRPLPREAIEKGSIQLSKREKARLKELEVGEAREGREVAGEMGVALEGRTEVVKNGKEQEAVARGGGEGEEKVEVAKEGLVCG